MQNWDSSHEEHAHTLAYSQEESEGSWLKIPWDSGWFPNTTPALTRRLLLASVAPALHLTKVKVLLAEEVTALGGSRANVDSDPPLNGGREATSWRKQRQYIKNGLRLPLACWTIPGHTTPHRMCTLQPLSIQHCSPLGWRWKFQGIEHTLENEQNSLDLNVRVLLHHLGLQAYPWECGESQWP